MKNQHWLFSALFITLLFSACKKDESVKVAPGKHFSLDKFEQNIKDALGGKTIGYAYSISQSGKQVRSGEGGFAIALWDAGNGIGYFHNATKRQDLASCSKTITALTLLSIMQEKGISLQDSLINYLPITGWNIASSPTFRTNTLENLMRHETGFPGGQIDYYSLKTFAEQGGIFIQGNYDYQNQNYAFLRIVIAYATHRTALQQIEQSAAGVNPNTLDSMINLYYIQEVNNRVFTKCGIPFTRPTPAAESNPTLNYNFNTQDPGWNKGDMTKYAGSAGWRLSAKEQNSIMAHLKYTTDIINDSWKQKMNDRMLGWERAWVKSVTSGIMYMHGGYFEDKYSPNASPSPAGRGCYTVHALFPNDYECAIQVNSLGGTPTMNTVAFNAYEGAWIE